MLVTSEPTKLRVLVCDDDRDTVDSTAMLLTIGGYSVRTAFNGVEAVAHTASFEPDVAMLDLAMPGFDGYQVAGAIQRLQLSKPPILVAVSGFGAGIDKQRCAEAGFDLHLIKPVAADVLERLDLLVTEEQRLSEQRIWIGIRYQETLLHMLQSHIEMGRTMLAVAATTREDSTKQRCYQKVSRICARVDEWIGANPKLASLRDDLDELVRRLQR